MPQYDRLDYVIYYNACLGDDGWYASMTMDWPSITWDNIRDNGPFESREAAIRFVKAHAKDIFFAHEVTQDEE